MDKGTEGKEEDSVFKGDDAYSFFGVNGYQCRQGCVMPVAFQYVGD